MEYLILSEHEKLIQKAVDLLKEYSEEELLFILQILEKMPPNKVFEKRYRKK